MSLFEEMKKLNNFGQRDSPKSFSLISKINYKLEALLTGIKGDETDKKILNLIGNMDTLQDQLTEEFSALWSEIYKHEDVEDCDQCEESFSATRRIMTEDRD